MIRPQPTLGINTPDGVGVGGVNEAINLNILLYTQSWAHSEYRIYLQRKRAAEEFLDKNVQNRFMTFLTTTAGVSRQPIHPLINLGFNENRAHTKCFCVSSTLRGKRMGLFVGYKLG